MLDNTANPIKVITIHKVRILITGGAGFIGSHFTKYLLKSHSSEVQKIRVLDKLTYSGHLSNFSTEIVDSIEFMQGDVCDPQAVRSAMRDVDVVFHFAAETHVDRSLAASRKFFESNVIGTQNLLEVARLNELQTFIHISTDEVYGSIKEGSWKESAKLDPNSPYAASKAGSDLLAMSFARTYNMDVRITRSCNNYGPNQFPEKIIPLFITNLIEGKKVPLYGEGTNVREWIHVNDHCRGLFLTYQHGKPREIYHLGGGEEITNLELTLSILAALELDEQMIFRISDRLGHDYRYSLNSRKAEEMLGFVPTYNLSSEIPNIVKWYRENRAWWEPLKRSIEIGNYRS